MPLIFTSIISFSLSASLASCALLFLALCRMDKVEVDEVSSIAQLVTPTSTDYSRLLVRKEGRRKCLAAVVVGCGPSD